MSHEILYTSAPQGLKPGSRGFCTVVSTAGMAKNLAERLESFSGYRHAFLAHEARADQNPINYAHYHTIIGGRKYHILSRIADAGLDYTQRSNKLAHHVALEPSETANAPGGPAWVMAAKGFFLEQWDGQVRTLPTGREPTASDRPPQICDRWKQLTGDAGWGGVLAESAFHKGGVMSVIFAAGTPVLDLVVESLGLLPPEKRWDVTFSTYFTKAPAGIDCQWRFLLDGTPEATALRRDVRAAVIDLCQPLGQAPDGDWTQAARAGLVSRRGPSRIEAPLQRSAPDLPRPVATTVQPPVEESGELSLTLLTPPSPTRHTLPPPAWLPSATPRRSRRWLVPIAVAGLLVIALGTVLGVVLSLPRTVPSVQVASPHPTPSPKPEPSKALAPAPSQEQVSEDEVRQESDAPTAASQGTPKETEKLSVQAEKKPEPKADPFKDIRRRARKLELPPLTPPTSGGGGALGKPQPNKELLELAKLPLGGVRDCTLQLLGHEFEPRAPLKHRIFSADDNGKVIWKVITEREDLLNKKNVTTTPIATFTLDEGQLRFNWETAQPPLRLALCLLKITAGGEFETCSFTFASKPVSSIDFASKPTASKPSLTHGGKALIDLAVARNYLPRVGDDLVLDLKFSGIEKALFRKNKIAVSGGKDGTTLVIPVPAYDDTDPAGNVSVNLSVTGDTEKDLYIESRMVADGHELTLLDKNAWISAVAQDTRMPRPERKSLEIELSDEKIDAHQKKEEDKFRNFGISVGKGVDAEGKDLSKLKKDLETIEKELRVKCKNKADIEAQWPSVDPDKIKKVKDAEDAIVKLVQAAQYKHYAIFMEEVKAWSKAVKEIKTRLEKDGRLDYRLYMKVDDREIELVKTEGFSDNKPVAAANE